MRFEEIRLQMSRQRSGPLVFLHIPKTAGVSLIQALRNLKPWVHTFTGPPFLSPELLAQVAALPRNAIPETLVYGHPLAGTFPAMQNSTLLTVVREPAAHTVSHYLFTQRRREIPLHAESLKLDFGAFVRKNWQYLVYQSISLGITDSLKCDLSQKDFEKCVPRIHDIFRRIDVVGTTDDLPHFIGKVARMLGVNAPGIERLNQATEEGISAERIADLHGTYQCLAQDPDFAKLIAYEQALYHLAKQRSAFAL